MRYNNISVYISSPESDSELTAMNSAIALFARLQETTSQYTLTLCHPVFLVLRLHTLRPPASQYTLTLCHPVFPVLRLPALRPPASQYTLTLCHAVFPVLRLPALRPPASQYTLTLCHAVFPVLRLNVRPAFHTPTNLDEGTRVEE